MENIKLLIGISTSEMGLSRAHYNVLALKRPPHTSFQIDEQFDVSRSRNSIVKKMLEENFTHLFFLDSDMYFVPSQREALLNLLKHDLPVVSGLYYNRGPPHFPIMLFLSEDKPPKFKYQYCSEEDYPKNQLVKVDACGAGCLLIKREVLEKMRPPWFLYTLWAGEDVYFCLKCRTLGYDVYVDTGVTPLHFIESVVGPTNCLQEYFAQVHGVEANYSPPVTWKLRKNES